MRRSLGIILAVWAVARWAAPGTETERPEPVGVARPEVLALVAQAETRLAGGEYAEGLRLFRRAAELDPANPELAEEFGLALAEAGVNDEAVTQLQKAGSLTANGEATLGLLMAPAAQATCSMTSGASTTPVILRYRPSTNRAAASWRFVLPPGRGRLSKDIRSRSGRARSSSRSARAPPSH